MTVGMMRMPPDFKYADVFFKGKPTHSARDPFARRHPAMDCSRRAKIFSPFDALRGFGDAIAITDVTYIPRPDLCDDDKAEINRRITILRDRVRGGRAARESLPPVTVTYFVPCADPNLAADGGVGLRARITGACRRVDPEASRSVTVGDTAIRFDDILSIEAESLFGRPPEPDGP